jgi:hypothetical protein
MHFMRLSMSHRLAAQLSLQTSITQPPIKIERLDDDLRRDEN